MRGLALDSELSQLLSFEEQGRVLFRPSIIASFGSGVIQEDLKGVEIPENPNYGYDEAYYNNYSYVKAYYDNYDYPRTYRMSKKITEDKCSRAMGAECNDKIVALSRAGRGITCLV